MGSCCTKVSDKEQEPKPVTLPPFPVVTNNPVVTQSAPHVKTEGPKQQNTNGEEVTASKKSKAEENIQKSLEITKEIVDQTSATGSSDDNDDSDGNGSWTEV